jgi:small subunit ribosomal protein S1
MSRFERLKKNWKGPQLAKSDAGLEFSYADFSAAVAETNYSFNRFDVVSGVCVEYDQKGVIVDIGAKASAYLPVAEAALIQESTDSISDLVQLDVPLEFQIISEEDENGQLLVSIRRIQYRKAWETVLAVQDSDEVFMAPVIAVNRGGAICLVHGLRAFLPGSHLSGMSATDAMIGMELPLKFLEVNLEANKILVVSHRKVVWEQQMTEWFGSYGGYWID